MVPPERDSTQDWLLRPDSAPPLLGELVDRIDEALKVAYASESAIDSAGAAATDAAERARAAMEQAQRAAEQAYRSAEFAERASVAMLEDRRRRAPADAPVEDPGLRSFSDRADRVVARLRALERLPA
jgi:phosphodiesterase/alkaline phosphatase D-like protein